MPNMQQICQKNKNAKKRKNWPSLRNTTWQCFRGPLGAHHGAEHLTAIREINSVILRNWKKWQPNPGQTQAKKLSDFWFVVGFFVLIIGMYGYYWFKKCSWKLGDGFQYYVSDSLGHFQILTKFGTLGPLIYCRRAEVLYKMQETPKHVSTYYFL